MLQFKARLNGVPLKHTSAFSGVTYAWLLISQFILVVDFGL